VPHLRAASRRWALLLVAGHDSLAVNHESQITIQERRREVPRCARDDRLKREHGQEWLCHKTTSPITAHCSPITCHVLCAHACQDAAHVGEAFDYAWHGVVFVDFIF
jgi:hypothetical protein